MQTELSRLQTHWRIWVIIWATAIRERNSLVIANQLMWPALEAVTVLQRRQAHLWLRTRTKIVCKHRTELWTIPLDTQLQRSLWIHDGPRWSPYKQQYVQHISMDCTKSFRCCTRLIWSHWPSVLLRQPWIHCTDWNYRKNNSEWFVSLIER